MKIPISAKRRLKIAFWNYIQISQGPLLLSVTCHSLILRTKIHTYCEYHFWVHVVFLTSWHYKTSYLPYFFLLNIPNSQYIRHKLCDGMESMLVWGFPPVCCDPSMLDGGCSGTWWEYLMSVLSHIIGPVGTEGAIASHMMTLWHGNIFRITGSMWGESTGHQWIPLTKSL